MLEEDYFSNKACSSSFTNILNKTDECNFEHFNNDESTLIDVFESISSFSSDEESDDLNMSILNGVKENYFKLKKVLKSSKNKLNFNLKAFIEDFN